MFDITLTSGYHRTMKKEVFLAIILGIVLGVGLVAAARYQHQLGQLLQEARLSQPTPVPVAKKKQNVPTATPSPAGIPLTIEEPVDNAVVAKSPLLIRGHTLPGATVVIIGDEDEVILVADDKGEFSTKFNLSGGANDLEITAYDQQGKEKKILLTVTYSTAKF